MNGQKIHFNSWHKSNMFPSSGNVHIQLKSWQSIVQSAAVIIPPRETPELWKT